MCFLQMASTPLSKKRKEIHQETLILHPNSVLISIKHPLGPRKLSEGNKNLNALLPYNSTNLRKILLVSKIFGATQSRCSIRGRAHRYINPGFGLCRRLSLMSHPWTRVISKQARRSTRVFAANNYSDNWADRTDPPTCQTGMTQSRKPFFCPVLNRELG